MDKGTGKTQLKKEPDVNFSNKARLIIFDMRGDILIIERLNFGKVAIHYNFTKVGEFSDYDEAFETLLDYAKEY